MCTGICYKILFNPAEISITRKQKYKQIHAFLAVLPTHSLRVAEKRITDTGTSGGDTNTHGIIASPVIAGHRPPWRNELMLGYIRQDTTQTTWNLSNSSIGFEKVMPQAI
jgi:hypothetical protein